VEGIVSALYHPFGAVSEWGFSVVFNLPESDFEYSANKKAIEFQLNRFFLNKCLLERLSLSEFG
jgi:hypothetical protein